MIRLGCVGGGWGEFAFLVVLLNCPLDSCNSSCKQGQDLSPALLDCEFYTSTDIFSDVNKGASTEFKEPQPISLDPSQPGGADSLSFRPPYC